MKEVIFKTTNFRYITSGNDIIPDSLIFVQNGVRYQVVFDQDQGWHKSITRKAYPVDIDTALGRIIGDNKIFRIYQDKTVIQWVFRKIPFENIII